MATVSTYHASDGAAYDVFLGRWTRELAPLLIDFASVAPDGALLDVGTGTGSLARAMAGRWPSRKVVGVDVAAPYIAFARANSTAPHLEFKIGDAAALGHPDGAFAGAIAQLVLNFVPNAGLALREMRRVTRLGGTVAAAVWDFRGGLVYQRLFWDTASGIDPRAADARDRLFSGALALPDGLPTLFSDAGLVDVQRG